MTLFFYGANSFALRRQLEQMTKAYLQKNGSNFGLERIDGSVIKPRELMASLSVAPFLATSRLVIVEGLASNKMVAEKIVEILKSVPSTTVAVFIERAVDQRTTIFKALCKADKVLKFDPLDGQALRAWVSNEVSRIGGSMDTASLNLLLDFAGDDQWRLLGEVTKLVNFNTVINPAMIHELVTPSVQVTIFNMIEAMTAGDARAANAAYRALIARRENEMYLLTMIAWQLRNLLLAKAAPAQMSPAEVARATGMSPFVAGKMAAAQARISLDVLTESFKRVVDCEYHIKTGRLRAEVAIEQLIFAVASRPNQ